jgi:hypothetical protein
MAFVKLFLEFLPQFRDAHSSLTTLMWTGTMFGIFGDVVEGDVDENGEVGDPNVRSLV